MTNKYLTIGLVVVAIVAIYGCFTPSGKATLGQIVDTFTGDIFDATTSFKLNGVTFFSSAGLASTVIVNNGVSTESVRQSLTTTASTTPCSIQNPLNATSTWTMQINLTTATGTTAALSLATSTTAFSTSTAANPPLFTAAGGKLTLLASNLKTLNIVPALDTGTIGPSQWLVIGAQGGPGTPDTGFLYGGTCQATFQSVSN